MLTPKERGREARDSDIGHPVNGPDWQSGLLLIVAVTVAIATLLKLSAIALVCGASFLKGLAAFTSALSEFRGSPHHQ